MGLSRIKNFNRLAPKLNGYFTHLEFESDLHLEGSLLLSVKSIFQIIININPLLL